MKNLDLEGWNSYMKIEIANLKTEVLTTAVRDLLNVASKLNYGAYKTYK